MKKILTELTECTELPKGKGVRLLKADGATELRRQVRSQVQLGNEGARAEGDL